MNRFFNTAGPIRRDDHYYIEPLDRFDLPEMLTLIEQKKYFVLHAPRQTGKTTYMHALTDYLNKQGKYKCLYINVEAAQAARENAKEGMHTILRILANESFLYLKDSFLEERWKQILENSGEFYALQDALMKWCQASDTPIILFIDEVDALVGDTLIAVLRQLRSGYDKRPELFPQSIVLCGVRDVKDYRMHSDREKTIITGGSAFNIKAKSLKMGNFTPLEIEKLYRQHTEETGQSFNKDVFPLVWELTEGQPWLVNALAYEACFEMKEGNERGIEITADMIEQAKENLILRGETHLDQLSDKLKEERVRRVLEPLLSSSQEAERIPEDDVDYVVDLGLVKIDRQLRIANRIYREVIPRTLTYSTQLTINQEASWYMKDDGGIDMDKLLTAFQEFFRKNFEHWADGFDYSEAGPQLLLQSFLQRIVNGGGRVEREYGLGRQRTDLLIQWPYKGGKQEVVIELKLLYGTLETTIEKGLEQTRQYMDKCGTREGYLLIINRSSGISWEEKIFKKERTFKDVSITVYGM
ncbi:MAG: AAA-like domain-containing protein [Candidatus Aminicenantes bacterium]|nr:AAA-like domain-containing protein [Candidatus Aminicenantes bacterium]